MENDKPKISLVVWFQQTVVVVTEGDSYTHSLKDPMIAWLIIYTAAFDHIMV